MRVARRRRRVVVAGRPAMPGVDQSRQGFARVGRRRQRVRRPARRLRHDGGGPRPPGHRRGREPAGGRGHPLRPAGARPDPRLGRARPSLRAAVVALRQLRHRGHDGRPAPDARRHRSPADHQGRGQLPRSPRRRAGLGLSGGDRRRAARPAPPGSRAHRRLTVARRLDPRRAVRPPRRRAAGSCSPIPARSRA